MLAATWSLRPDGNHPTAFTLKINHGGQLTCPPNVRYIGGKSNWFDDVDADTFSTIEVQTMVKDLGYPDNNTCKNKPSESNPAKGPSESNPAKRPCESNAGKSFSESNDGKRGSGSSNVKRPSGSNKGKRPIVIEDDDGSDSSEYSGDSEDSDDSDFDIGDEDIIGDVDVDMDDFRKHTNENVEWIECTEKEVQVPPPFDYEEVDLEEFGSGTESDDVERCFDVESQTRQFRRIYICLGALKNGFKAGKRDLLGLDGCFLSGPYPGQILTAVGVDPNNGIYPLTYAVVEGETKESWQKGLIPALQETFPAAEHRYCLKHIYDNMKLQWRGEQYKDLLWRSATATTVQRFGKNMEEIKKLNPEMYNWLKDIPPQHWARSHFSGRPHCDVLLNNMCEVLNRQLLKGRDKPIVTCLEFIREYLMKRIVIVQGIIDKSTGPLTPNATKLFNLIKRDAAQYKVIWNGGDLYDTTGPYGDKCVVNIRSRSCACRKWEITGMPCKHAVASIWNMANNGLEPGIPEHNQRSCKGQRHQGSHAPPQASQASSQASQAPPSSSQDSQAPPSSSQASQVFTRFTKSTAKFVPQRPATTKKNGSNAKGKQ
ncbi:mutator type transposase [Tanacetum coccineum]